MQGVLYNAVNKKGLVVPKFIKLISHHLQVEILFTNWKFLVTVLCTKPF